MTPHLNRRTNDLALHTQADQIPLLPEREYPAFRADVAARGVQVPLEVTKDGIVLDGRQRLRAARELEIDTVPVRVVAVADELDHMFRAAILRRQLTASQRAALIVEREEYRQLQGRGRRRQRANLVQSPEVETLPPRGRSRDEAGDWGAVCGRTIQDASTVHAHDPELFERIKRNEISASNAAGKVRRRLRDQQLPPPPPLPEGPFELIYADPPWQLGNPDSLHAPEHHYPTMSLEEIKALDVPAADDAVLFLWAVSSLLPQAIEVIETWGFEFKTTIVWVKDWIGLGVWVRNRHELLLVARRGNHPPPEREDRIDSVIEARRGRHSQKPERVYELLERMYPQAYSKLELFARQAQPGWITWGNEVDQR